MNLLSEKYILATNILSSGFLVPLGDLIEQQIEYRRNLSTQWVNYSRLGKMFIMGLIEGLIHHIHYVVFLNNVLPKNDLRSIAKKVLLDQCIASPLFICTFFYCMGFLEGKTLKESTNELKSKMWKVYIMDWLIWPPVQFVNFYFIPAHYTVAFVNVITMVYNVFLSYIKHIN